MSTLKPIDSRKSQSTGHARAATDSAAMGDSSANSSSGTGSTLSSWTNGWVGGGGSSSNSSTTEGGGGAGTTRSLLGRAKSKAAAARQRPLSYVSSRTSTDGGATDAFSAKVPAGDNGLHPFTGVFTHPESSCHPTPAPELTQEQQRKYETMLAYFRERSTFPTRLLDRRRVSEAQSNAAKGGGPEQREASDWEKLRLLTRESLLRYLRATKWDVEAAKQRLLDTIAWRREYGVDTISPDEVEPEAKSGKETVLGFDNYCRPLHYMHPHRNDTQESPRQMRFAVWILESCIDMMPPGVEKLALLINFENKSRNPTSISNSKMMLYILQNHYVERLGVALCINVPWVFKAFWSAVQPFIDPVTKSKCKFDEAIKDEVPAVQLGADFGGKLDFHYDHEQYWPDLCRVIEQKRAELLRRFREQCGAEIGASEWVIRGGDEEKAVQKGEEDKHAQANGAPVAAAAAVTPPVVNDSKANGHAAPAVAPATPSKDAASEQQQQQQLADSAAGKGSREQLGGTLQRLESSVTSGGEVFTTPSTSLADNPLERKFSAATTAPTLGDVAEKPDAEEQAAQAQTLQPPPPVTPLKLAQPANQHGRDASAASVGDPETPRLGGHAGLGEKGSEGGDSADGKDGHHHHLKEGFQEFVKGGSHFFKNLKAGVAGVGIHSHVSHRKSGSRTVSTSSTLVASGASAGASGGGERDAHATNGAAVHGPESTTPAAGEQSKALETSAASTSPEAPAVAPSTTSASSQTIKVLYFAGARTALKKSSEQFPLPEVPLSLARLGELLLDKYREHDITGEFEKVLKTSKWSVNEDIVDEDEAEKTLLHGGEEVALIPPVSGG